MLRNLLLTISLLAAPLSLSAQDTTRTRPESEKKGMMDDHMMGPWKEMNSFHRVMAATWHPAQKNDLAPIRAQAKALLAASDTWAASTPPAMPASCGAKETRAAATKVATEAKALVALIDSGADDVRVKSALKRVHDAFEVAEKACGGHGGMTR